MLPLFSGKRVDIHFAQARGAEALANGLLLLIDGAFSERRLLGATGSPIALIEPSAQLLRACGVEMQCAPT